LTRLPESGNIDLPHRAALATLTGGKDMRQEEIDRERAFRKHLETCDAINAARECPECGHIDLPGYDQRSCFNCMDW
jgi:ribosomal protein L32